MTTAQVFTNGVQLGSPVPPSQYPFTGGGDVDGPASATNNGIAVFDGTTGKIIKSTPSTVDTFGGIILAAGAQTFPVVPVPANATPLNFYEDRDIMGVVFSGPWAAGVVNDINLTRVGDRQAQLSLGEVLNAYAGAPGVINFPPGTIPANFRPLFLRKEMIAVQVDNATFVPALCYVHLDGSIEVGASLNGTGPSPTPIAGVLGQLCGFRSCSINYSI